MARGREMLSMASLHPEFFIRLYLARSLMMGPGKAALLEGIARTGSISAAGRDLGMSYKRAWMLVETMNAMFREPVVSSARGGPGGGGAILTETGRTALALYREIEAASVAVNADRIDRLRSLLADVPDEK